MDLNKLLQTGSLVELEITNPGEKKAKTFHVIIDKPYNNGIFTVSSPMQQGRNYPVKNESIVKIVFSFRKDNEQEAYSLKCKVVSRSNSKKFNTLTLESISSPEKVQRREYFRFSIVENIKFTYAEEIHDMLTVNISATGLRGITTKKIPDGESITIDLPLEKSNLRLYGEVVNSNLSKGSQIKYDTRIKFVNITENQKSKITNFIFSKQSEMALKSLNREGYNPNFLNLNFSGDEYFQTDSNSFKKLSSPISLLISIVLIGLFTKSMPEKMNGLDMFFHNLRNSSWKLDYLYLTVLVSLIQILFSSFGIISKRSTSGRVNRVLLSNLIFALLLLLICGALISISNS